MFHRTSALFSKNGCDIIQCVRPLKIKPARAGRPTLPMQRGRGVGRYRAPQAAGSKYITPEGERRLREELDELWRVERPRVTQAVSEAAAQGDRSENAEYTYGKRRLREIDRRVRFLRKRLDGMVIVQQRPSDPNRVFFGAWVAVEADDGSQFRYRIVGPDEFDREPGYISMDSPLGRALLGKRLDDELTAELPGRVRTFVIVQIRYDDSASSPTP
jgi:transcription elongation factor GreB